MYFKVPNKGTYLQKSTQEVSGNRVYQFFGPFLIQLWREQIVGTIGLKNVKDLGKNFGLDSSGNFCCSVIYLI